MKKACKFEWKTTFVDLGILNEQNGKIRSLKMVETRAKFRRKSFLLRASYSGHLTQKSRQ